MPKVCLNRNFDDYLSDHAVAAGGGREAGGGRRASGAAPPGGRVQEEAK